MRSLIVGSSVRDDWADTLVSDATPGHEGLVEVDVAGVNDFAPGGDPHAVAAGHAGAQPEVDACDSIRVEFGLRVRDTR